jgi:hypothetical protein
MHFNHCGPVVDGILRAVDDQARQEALRLALRLWRITKGEFEGQLVWALERWAAVEDLEILMPGVLLDDPASVVALVRRDANPRVIDRLADAFAQQPYVDIGPSVNAWIQQHAPHGPRMFSPGLARLELKRRPRVHDPANVLRMWDLHRLQSGHARVAEMTGALWPSALEALAAEVGEGPASPTVLAEAKTRAEAGADPRYELVWLDALSTTRPLSVEEAHRARLLSARFAWYMPFSVPRPSAGQMCGNGLPTTRRRLRFAGYAPHVPCGPVTRVMADVEFGQSLDSPRPPRTAAPDPPTWAALLTGSPQPSHEPVGPAFRALPKPFRGRRRLDPSLLRVLCTEHRQLRFPALSVRVSDLAELAEVERALRDTTHRIDTLALAVHGLTGPPRPATFETMLRALGESATSQLWISPVGPAEALLPIDLGEWRAALAAHAPATLDSVRFDAWHSLRLRRDDQIWLAEWAPRHSDTWGMPATGLHRVGAWWPLTPQGPGGQRLVR